MSQPSFRVALAFVLLGAVVQAAVADADQPLVADARPALPWPPEISPETMCGTTEEYQDVELYDGQLGPSVDLVMRHQPTTLQLRWVDKDTIRSRLPDHAVGTVGGQPWCTGSLIGPSLVLTAGHCLDAQRGADRWFTPFRMVGNAPVFAPPEKLASLLVAVFLYQINGETREPREEIVFPVVELLEHRREGLDYALLELGPGADGRPPGDSFGAAEVATREPREAELAMVIQHPRGWRKKVEAGRILRTVGSEAWYDDIDTYGASSGSGIRDGEGKLIGVHTHGGCNTNGGNRGVTTAAIARASDAL